VATEKIKFYQHDLKPDLTVQIERETAPKSGVFLPVPLDDAVALNVIGVRDGAVVLERDALPTSAAGLSTGLVTMPWEAGDTDVVGLLRVEVEVVWPGNKPETFRPDQAYNIVADFG
jgi:hypothetical protein